MSTFTGERNDAGDREGRGTMHFVSGALYSGEWRAGVREGYGIMRFAGGETYEGQWVGNQCEGHGVHTYADGSTYDGEWLASRRDGEGVYTFANGSRFEGGYRNGLRDGVGTFYFPNGVAQISRFEAGEARREGARWSNDHDGLPSTAASRHVVWRMRDGMVDGSISLIEAEVIAQRLSVRVPQPIAPLLSAEEHAPAVVI